MAETRETNKRLMHKMTIKGGLSTFVVIILLATVSELAGQIDAGLFLYAISGALALLMFVGKPKANATRYVYPSFWVFGILFGGSAILVYGAIYLLYNYLALGGGFIVGAVIAYALADVKRWQ